MMPRSTFFSAVAQAAEVVFVASAAAGFCMARVSWGRRVYSNCACRLHAGRFQAAQSTKLRDLLEVKALLCRESVLCFFSTASGSQAGEAGVEFVCASCLVSKEDNLSCRCC